MGLNHAENQETELGFQSTPLRRNEPALEIEVENHLRKLDKLVENIPASQDQVTLSGAPQVIDYAQDLREKIKASHNMVRVAKLLSEPARESMFSKVRDSFSDLEEDITYHLRVKTN